MNVWFTADTHLRHKFMADLRGIGRDALDDHDELIISTWNSHIAKRDVVWFLGDFSFGKQEENRKFFAALNGVKHLVRGNHDPANVCNLAWSSVSDLKKISIMGQSLVLCHYPMLTWQNAHHGTWHLHGHCHGNLRAPESTRLDVGWDNFGRPISYEEVHEILSARQYDFIDHHE